MGIAETARTRRRRAMRRRKIGNKGLGPFLDAVLRDYDSMDYVTSDPVSVPHEYARPADREVAAYIAAMLAFGNVRAMLPRIREALAPLGDHPADHLRRAAASEIVAGTRGFNYRWIFEDDLAAIFLMLQGVLREDGSLERAFRGDEERTRRDPIAGGARLVGRLRAAYPEADVSRRGTRAFLPQVTGSSASKRYHLFLRWMTRTEGVDLGLWGCVDRRDLWMPVDTHVARIARYIGLTDRQTVGWPMVREITERLRTIDPNDPVKYDFALSRLGILGACPSRRDAILCARCALVPVCRL